MFLLPATPMRAVSGRSGPMRVGFPNGTRRYRLSHGAHPLLGRRVCALREMISLPHNNYVLTFEALFWLQNLCILRHGT
jgi:hypothetical protein